MFLVYRRRRGNMIQIFKILNDYVRIDKKIHFSKYEKGHEHADIEIKSSRNTQYDYQEGIICRKKMRLTEPRYPKKS